MQELEAKRTVTTISDPTNEWIIENEPTPSNSSESIFLFDIPTLLGCPQKSIENYQQQLAFREVLLISQFQEVTDKFNKFVLGHEEIHPVGGMCVDIQFVEPDKFLVYVATQLEHKKNNGGSQITSWLQQNLQTVEERRIDFLNTSPCVNKCELYIGIEEDSYYVTHNNKLKTISKSETYNFSITNILICEGANFVLMRFLALIRFVGSFETTTLYLNGDLCRNVYFSEGAETALVNNTKCDVIRIQRVIKEKCGIVHNCITTLLLNGRIVRQEWEKCCYLLHLNFLVDVDCFKSPTSLLPDWPNDLQLYSKFLDFNEQRLMIHKDYYADHPELRSLISAYCQQILQQKPHEILQFTIDFFKTINAKDIPYNAYFEQGSKD